MGADRMLRQLNLFESGVEKLRGICMGKLKDKFYYFAVGSTGTIERYRIASVNQVVLEDRWQLKSEAEGCVVDEPGNRVYIAEENTGIWYIPLSSTPKIKSEPELLDKVSFLGPSPGESRAWRFWRMPASATSSHRSRKKVDLPFMILRRTNISQPSGSMPAMKLMGFLKLTALKFSTNLLAHNFPRE